MLKVLSGMIIMLGMVRSGVKDRLLLSLLELNCTCCLCADCEECAGRVLWRQDRGVR